MFYKGHSVNSTNSIHHKNCDNKKILSIMLKQLIPADWADVLQTSINSSSFDTLETFLLDEWQQHTVFPEKENIFNAFKLTPFDQVKVLILGQDPYHDDGQAHGLCFSVQTGTKIPPSLRNIYKEMDADLDIEPASHGCLENWAKQGILLLNTVLTVRAHQANSHQKKGWEQFTDDVIQRLNQEKDGIIFVLWGNSAQKKGPLIDDQKHVILSSAHPSPLSARHGFFGSKPFSRINQILEKQGQEPIDWQLPEEQPSLPLF